MYFASCCAPLNSTVACVAGGFKGLGVYGEGNYGERNEKDVYNIIRRRREKLGTRRGEEENAVFLAG